MKPGENFIISLAQLTEEDKKKRLLKWSQITHFVPDEFDSPDQPGTGILMNIEFMFILDQIRSKVGFPIRISSGFRTPEHNNKVAVVENSAHTYGLAADLVIHGGHERDAILKASFLFGIHRRGIGNNFIHLDLDYTKPQNVTWTY